MSMYINNIFMTGGIAPARDLFVDAHGGGILQHLVV